MENDNQSKSSIIEWLGLGLITFTMMKLISMVGSLFGGLIYLYLIRQFPNKQSKIYWKEYGIAMGAAFFVVLMILLITKASL